MANKTITDLTAAAALDGTELVHVQQGANSRKTTTAELAEALPSGSVTITRAADSDGWFSSAEPFNSVALSPTYADANYTVALTVTAADDMGRVGDVIAYDFATNGFKIKFTGSTDNVDVRWVIGG